MKVAIVTGAASGIGAAIAKRLAVGGAEVCKSDLRGKPCDIEADVTIEDDVRSLVDETVKKFGRLDIMVNNAGIGERTVPIDEKPAAKWQRVIDTNLTSVFFGIKHAARAMKNTGGGVIINISSILGSAGLTGAPAYTAAKHGVIGLTKAAALELASFKIRVVAVQPGFIHTPLIKTMDESALVPLHPIGRLGEPDEVAALVAFLASDEAAFMTGGYLIDGGYTAQ